MSLAIEHLIILPVLLPLATAALMVPLDERRRTLKAAISVVSTLGSLWIAFALAGLTFVVQPWNWQGDLAPKLWALLAGFGWAAGTVSMKYFQRGRELDPLNFVA